MERKQGRTLVVEFGYHSITVEPQDPPCPDGFSGPVPADPGGDGGTDPPDPIDLFKVSLSFVNKSLGTILAPKDSEPDGPPQASLTFSFSDSDEETNCAGWADLLCWRPEPLDYIAFMVTKALYSGTYEQDMALPSVTGELVTDSNGTTITLDEVEVPDEENEGETKMVKPSFKVMWPTGDLHQYITLEHYLNPWYLAAYRLRKEIPEDMEDMDIPPMWINGPIFEGDKRIGPAVSYSLRVPVVFTWAAGEVPPLVPSGAVGIETFQEFITAEDAFKPENDGYEVIVAKDPEPGEEPDAPGVQVNEATLNDWLARRPPGADPLTEEVYTLLMEIRPAWGHYGVTGKYACEDEVYDLTGNYGFNRDDSNLLHYPLLKVPVAYLRLPQEEEDLRTWLVIFIHKWYAPEDTGYYELTINDTSIGDSAALLEPIQENNHTYIAWVEAGCPYSPPDLQNFNGGPATLVRQYTIPSGAVNRGHDGWERPLNTISLLKQGGSCQDCYFGMAEVNADGDLYIKPMSIYQLSGPSYSGNFTVAPWEE